MEKQTFSETLALASTLYFYVYLFKRIHMKPTVLGRKNSDVEFQVRKWYVVLPKLSVFEILLHFSNIWIRIKRFLIRLTCFQKSPALWQKKRSEIGLLDSSIHQTPVQSPPCQTAWAATRAARSWLTEPAWSLSTWLFGDSCEVSETNLWHYHSTMVLSNMAVGLLVALEVVALEAFLLVSCELNFSWQVHPCIKDFRDGSKAQHIFE